MTSSRGVYDSKGLMEGRRWHPHNCPLFFRHARAILADRTHVQHNLPTKQLILIVHVLFWTVRPPLRRPPPARGGWSPPETTGKGPDRSYGSVWQRVWQRTAAYGSVRQRVRPDRPVEAGVEKLGNLESLGRSIS